MSAGAPQPARLAPPVALRLQTPGALVWVALGIVYVVWGSTYLAIRVAVKTMPPLLMGGARFVTAGVLLLLIARFTRGPEALRVTRGQVVWACVIGSLLVTGGNGLVNLAERHIDSGLTALIISSVPLWVVVMRRVSGERVHGLTMASVGVGFVGVALLLLPGGGKGGQLIGYVLALCAAFSWAVGSFASRGASLPRDALTSTAIQMIAGGILSLVIGIARGEGSSLHPGSFSAGSIAAFLYLIFIGAIVAYTAYVWLLQHAPISKVSTYAYVNPVIAIFLGWLILSENITAMMLLGAAVVVGSVAVTVRKESG